MNGAVSEVTDPIDARSLVAGAGLATFEHVAQVGSTMERARELAGQPDPVLPALVVADRQLLGRGQRGARWWQADGSLAMSLVVDASAVVGGPPPAVWSLACGVALAESLAALVPKIDPLVRWPNDVEIGGRKIAGILVEALPGGRAIFGVGVNTTGSSREAPAEIAPRLVTIPDLVGTSLPRGRLLADFLPRLFALLVETAADPATLLPRHRARCSLAGEVVTVHRGGERLTGICRGIALDGALLLDTAAGRVVVRSGSLTPPEQVWRGGSRG